MKKNNNGKSDWGITIFINVALITLFSLTFVTINGMAEKRENDINDLKNEKQMIVDNINHREETKNRLIKKSRIVKIAEDSLKMISSLNKKR